MKIEELATVCGVSGDEALIRSTIIKEIEALNLAHHIDKMGNILVSKIGSGTERKKILLCAHMDEVGGIVCSITKEGYIKFKSVGGIDPRVLPAKRVLVGHKQIPGVIALKNDSPKKGVTTIEFSDLAVDIGENPEFVKDNVKLGDYIAFDSKYIEFGDLIKCKALDNRVGCAILLELMKKNYKNDITFAFTVKEEVGCVGAKVVTFGTNYDFCIVVETTICSDLENIQHGNFATELGKGAAITVIDRGCIAPKDLIKHLTDTADKHEIPWQYKQTAKGGNDSSAIHISQAGLKTVSVSAPCRYIHSPSCVCSISDIKACKNLIEKCID